MSEAETAEERAREQVESASRLRRQAEEARRDADRKAELAAEALRAYEECIERLRECEGAAPPAPGTEAPPPGGESRPEEQPKICGPDITASVLRLLEKVMEDYYAASGEQRGRACWAAIDLATALDAWDIYPLDPSSAPPEEGPLPGQKYWFEHISNRCGVPRNPCGPTVEFLGLCMHSQVVNYLLWGVMNRLCEDENLGEVLHWGRTTLSFGGAHYTGQTVMREVGGEFVDVMRRLYDPANMPDRNSQEELDRLRDYALTLKIENLLQLEGPESDWPARAAAQCQLTCELTENEKAKLDSVRWDYRWKHLKTPPRGSRRK